VRLDEIIHVDVELTKLNLSNARFSFRHSVYKEDGTLSATVNVDGAWLDLANRKLTNIPQEWYKVLDSIPKSEDYTEVTT
jgi:acyl-CoA thioester hydrolase